MGLPTTREGRFERGAARVTPWCAVDHSSVDGPPAPFFSQRESECGQSWSKLSPNRWLGRTEFRARAITSEPWVEVAVRQFRERAREDGFFLPFRPELRHQGLEEEPGKDKLFS